MAKSINVKLQKGFQLNAEELPLENISIEKLIFKGDFNNPFLAPRGVFLCKNKLIVADTGQNRVFVWNNIPTTEYQAPDLVLGQMEKENTARNKGTACSADSLMYPSGLWSDGQKLMIADAWNHRVLIWNEFPVENGQSADVVIGQPNFESNLPNVLGIGKAPSAQTLNWPYGLCSDGKKMWIADTGNRRVLVYNEIPKSNFAGADAVFGKTDMENRDYENEDAVWPYSVQCSNNGQIAVCDTQYFRVLLWDNEQKAIHQKSSMIIGQKDLESNGANQFELFPRSNTINWVYDSVFYKKGILVADTGNSRILWFDQLPNQNNAKANNLIGKPNFNTGSEFSDTRISTEKSIYWPFSIAVLEEENSLAIADTGNHRVILHQLLI